MDHIIKKLLALDKGEYKNFKSDHELNHNIGGNKNVFTNEQIDLLEKKYGTQLPEEYRKLMTTIGVFWLESGYGEHFETIGLFGFDEMYNDKLTPITGLNSDLKNVLAIGTNGGGYQWFYDLDNSSGCGKFSILQVDPGYCVWDSCIFNGISLADVLERMLTGSGLPKVYSLKDRE